MFFINARNDSLSEPTWKKALQEHRCLILADGFYEWKHADLFTKVKTPYRFELATSEPFAFAGLWQEEEDQKGKTEPHYVIITTEPNELVADVNNRMPAILQPEYESAWLDPNTTPEHALAMLKPYPGKAMKKYVVSRLVNSPANDNPEVIRPLNSQ